MSTSTIGWEEMVRIFLKAGARSFGGWSTTALILEKELTETRKLLTKRQLDGAVSYAQILPGATQVAMVSNAGYKLHGIVGACLAAICYLLPGLSLIVGFAFIYFRFAHSTQLTAHLGGLIAALGGVILANAYVIAKKHTSHPILWLAVVLAFVLKVFLGVNAVVIILSFGAIGLLYSVVMKRRTSHDS